jgi:hypothetical protein
MKKRIFLLNFSLLLSLFSFKNPNIGFGRESQKEVDQFIENFHKLTMKLPTYKEYFPGIYTCDNQGTFGISMIADQSSPKDIEAVRISISKTLKNNDAYKKYKMIAISFLEELEHPISIENLKTITVYVEHKKEKMCIVYCYPYKKKNNKIIFLKKLNFRKTAEKRIF